MAEEVIDQEETEIVDQEPEVQPEEGDEVQEETDVSEGAPDDDGLTVEISDEQEEEPEHITELRRRYREQQKKLKQYEQEGTPQQQQALPEKPTLESCDFDSADFEAKLADWYEKKREHDAIEAEQKSLAEKIGQRWNQKLQAYDEGKETLGVKDFDDVEAAVAQIFERPFLGINAVDARMGVLKNVAKDSATMVYALGRNPQKAAQLAAIEDPAEFAFALGELSAKMKVTRGKAPPPERKMGSSAPGVAGAVDNTLERLREEAAKTGDYSKVAAYKRSKR